MKKSTFDSTAPVDCVVNFRSGDYVTNTVRGQRASCTSSAERAALALASKLFGAGEHQVKQVGGTNVCGVWRLTPVRREEAAHA